MKHNNLKLVGDFLRAKRESIAPETVGLIKLARARTQGLRRDDVAEFAGISTIWYSKIERGQAAGISSQVLRSIATALCLTKLEYDYLCNLISPQAIPKRDPCYTISKHTAQLLLQLNPLPALLMNDNLDIVTCNSAFNLMVGLNIDELPLAEKNYLDLTINNAIWQTFLSIDSEDKLAIQITRMAGFLRDTLAKRPNDEVLQQKIASFKKQSHIFDKAWTDNTVLQPEERLYTYNHIKLGEIPLDKQLWWNFNGDASNRLNIYYPQNAIDRQRLLDILPEQGRWG